MKSTGWVALDIFVNEAAGMFYEAGGVDPHKPTSKSGADVRTLDAGEREVVCQRCGQRFVDTDEH